jgi:hypothetical protein
MDEGIVGVRGSANSAFVASMAKVSDSDVPAKLLNRVPGPLDPWYNETASKEGFILNYINSSAGP